MGPRQISWHRLGYSRLTYDRFIAWREQHIPQKNLVLILSFFVGALASCAAQLLKFMIHGIHHLVQHHLIEQDHWWYLITPMIGITLAGLFVKYVVKDDISHGITKILYAISQRKSIIKIHNTWSSLVGSALTIGFGGSVGAEAPIVLTGSAIGSNLANLFRLDQKTMMLMIGCGAAGAVGGIFQAPIAGLVFTLEVLMMDLTMTRMAPLLISSVTATAISFLVNGQEAMFPLTNSEPFFVERLPWYIILGVMCGLVSLYFTRTMNSLENIFRRYSNPYVKLAIGGMMLSILIYLFPSLYGEGYDLIHLLLNGDGPKEWNTSMDRSLFYGHENLLFLSPKINQDGVVKERYEGFQRALAESGLLHQAKYLEVEKCTLEAGQTIAKQVAQLEVTAVLATADILAIGLIQGLKMLGKSVPDDISVIGFDNLEVSQLITPSLSSIDQQLSQKVDVAIQQLVKLLKSPDTISEVIKIKPNLVSRESVKVLNR